MIKESTEEQMQKMGLKFFKNHISYEDQIKKLLVDDQDVFLLRHGINLTFPFIRSVINAYFDGFKFNNHFIRTKLLAGLKEKDQRTVISIVNKCSITYPWSSNDLDIYYKNVDSIFSSFKFVKDREHAQIKRIYNFLFENRLQNEYLTNLFKDDKDNQLVYTKEELVTLFLRIFLQDFDEVRLIEVLTEPLSQFINNHPLIPKESPLTQENTNEIGFTSSTIKEKYSTQI